MTPRRAWTAKEDRILAAMYPNTGADGLAATGLLPGRTRDAIRVRAHYLGVTDLRPQKRRNGRKGEDPAPTELAARAREIREGWYAERASIARHRTLKRLKRLAGAVAG